MIPNDPTEPDADGLAVDADENVTYEPESDSSVVAEEPKIIQVGRSEKKRYLRKLPEEQK